MTTDAVALEIASPSGGSKAAGSRWSRTFLTLTVGQAVAMPVRFVGLGLVARALEPGAFGVLSVAVICSTYFSTGAYAGIDVIGMREAAAGVPGMLSRVLRLRAAAGLSLLVVLAGVIAVLPLSKDRHQPLLVGLLILVPLSVDTRWFLVGRQRCVAVAVSDVVSAVGFLAATAVFVHRPHDVVAAVAVTIGAEAARVLVLLPAAYRLARKPHPDAPPAHLDASHSMSRIARRSLLVSGSALLRSAVITLDVVLVAAFLGRHDAGQYAAASRFYVVGLLLLGLCWQAFLPEAVRSVRAGADTKKLVHTFRLRALILFSPLVVIAIAVTPFAFPLLLGDDYRVAGQLFSIYAVGFAAVAANGLLIQLAIAYDIQGRLLPVIAFSLVVDLTLLGVLLPAIGLWGAPIAAVVSEFAALAGTYLVVRPALNAAPLVARAPSAAMPR